MGRRKKEIQVDLLLEMRRSGGSVKDIAREMGVSIPTLSRRIAELEHKKGILTKYRQLQGLQLTGLQFRILEAINPERIEKCSLSELLTCFHVLKKAELAIQGKGGLKIGGLLQYLIDMERSFVNCAEKND